MVTSALPPEASWEKLLGALKIKYQDKAPYDVLMAQFYGTKMDIDGNVLHLALGWNRS